MREVFWSTRDPFLRASPQGERAFQRLNHLRQTTQTLDIPFRPRSQPLALKEPNTIKPRVLPSPSLLKGGRKQTTPKPRGMRVSLHFPLTHKEGTCRKYLTSLLHIGSVVYRCCLSWLQALLTLSHKYFAPFNRSTCALSVSCRYLGLERIHVPSSDYKLK